MKKSLKVNFDETDEIIKDNCVTRIRSIRNGSKERPSSPYGRLLTTTAPNAHGDDIIEFEIGRLGSTRLGSEEPRKRSKEYMEHKQSTRASVRASRKETSKVFMDAELMKEKIRNAATTKPYDVCDFYHGDGLFQKIARNPRFEFLTLVVIAINALWILVDTDINPAVLLLQSAPVFQVVQQFFCLYFVFEWFVRFKSFALKRNCLRDPWFVFDTLLVLLVVLETWIMSCIVAFSTIASSGGLGKASMLRMGRFLRLSRMARMAKLFRAMPELVILIKAAAASLRACFFVFVLLAIILYIFGIMFRQLTDQSDLGNKYFFTVFASMHTLWKFGTLLDKLGDIVDELERDSYLLVVLFYLFLFFSALTVMNMLVGVLCEVVSSIASMEREEMTVTFVKEKLTEIIKLDFDNDGEITKQELSALLEFPEACQCLQDVGVDVFMLVDNIDFIFAGDEIDDMNSQYKERALSVSELMDVVLDMRGLNTATVKDIVQLQKYIKESNRRLREEIHKFGDDIKKSIRGADFTRSGGNRPVQLGSVVLPQPFTDTRGACGCLAKRLDSCSSRLGDSSSALSTPSVAALTSTLTAPKADPQTDEFLNILREELKLLVSKTIVPELHEAGLKVESECRSLLRALATELMDRDHCPEAVTQGKQNGWRPRLDNDSAICCNNPTKDATSRDMRKYYDTWDMLSVESI